MLVRGDVSHGVGNVVRAASVTALPLLYASLARHCAISSSLITRVGFGTRVRQPRIHSSILWVSRRTHSSILWVTSPTRATLPTASANHSDPDDRIPINAHRREDVRRARIESEQVSRSVWTMPCVAQMGGGIWTRAWLRGGRKAHAQWHPEPTPPVFLHPHRHTLSKTRLQALSLTTPLEAAADTHVAAPAKRDAPWL